MGGEPYPGLDFDPWWYLTDEYRDLRERLIRPPAIVSDEIREYPWKCLEALAGLGILGASFPESRAAGQKTTPGTIRDSSASAASISTPSAVGRILPIR